MIYFVMITDKLILLIRKTKMTDFRRRWRMFSLRRWQLLFLLCTFDSANTWLTELTMTETWLTESVSELKQTCFTASVHETNTFFSSTLLYSGTFFQFVHRDHLNHHLVSSTLEILLILLLSNSVSVNLFTAAHWFRKQTFIWSGITREWPFSLKLPWITIGLHTKYWLFQFYVRCRGISAHFAFTHLAIVVA